nr:anthocyanin biosynthesis-related transcription factor [Lilium hybrid division I]
MMERNGDLWLSLSLGSSVSHQRHARQQPNLMPQQSTELLASSSAQRGSPEMASRPMLRGFDVSQTPAVERESQEEAGTSSPNSTLSSVCGKPDHVMAIGDGRGVMISDEEDGEGSRKKLRLSNDQSAVLEEIFKEHNTLNPKQKQALARQLKLLPRQVEVWFQNRRARTKLKQTEVDCELLKQYFENLTDENRRLHKEIAELRALKLSSQLYMHMTPPTTLTMCPSCESVTPTNNGTASATPAFVDNHHLQHSHHHRLLVPASATPATWATAPLRAASFLDVMKPQQS